MDKNVHQQHQKHGCLWWGGRILIGFVIVLMVGFGIVLLAGAKAKSDLKAKYPPPGNLVDVGGYRLHIFCEGKGSPTVVFEAGLGDPSLIWELVRPEIAKTTRVCVYDRAGLGWSDPSPKSRTAENIVKELHTLLTGAGIPGPYVLVGHSVGGMYLRLYAHDYPDNVVGIVLVDSAHEEQVSRAPEAFAELSRQAKPKKIQGLEAYKPFAAIGVFALVPSQVPVDAELPKAAQEAFQALAAKDTGFLETVIAEEKAFDESLTQVEAAHITTLGNIPLIVLCHGQFGLNSAETGLSSEVIQQVEQGWRQLQTELAALSPQGKLVVAEQSGHYIHLQQPQLVIDAIKQVVAAARK